jgi:hypothetical protein
MALLNKSDLLVSRQRRRRPCRRDNFYRLAE